jgi:hypothetical protein
VMNGIGSMRSSVYIDVFVVRDDTYRFGFFLLMLVQVSRGVQASPSGTIYRYKFLIQPFRPS